MPLDGRTALQLLAGVHRHDPLQRATLDDLARMVDSSFCYALTDGHGAQAALALRSQPGLLWVNACKGRGGGEAMAPGLLSAIELLARSTAHDAVAFQTRRRGLVRRAQDSGYQVAGWILKKELPLWT